jgi:type IV pilus modification protein PilV
LVTHTYSKDSDLPKSFGFNSLTSTVGFSLIEVMVSLAVMSIATLGYIQFQIGLQRGEYDASNHQIALMLAHDMGGRIRGNRSNASIGAASSYNGGNNLSGIYNSNCIGVSNLTCYGDQLAKFDLWEWGQYIQALLPPGSTGSINVTNPNYHTITITWPSPLGMTQSVGITIVP